jgi:MFS family permease
LDPRSRLTRDGRLLFATRILRLFAYGFLSVVLVLYLTEAGLTEREIGLLLTLTLLGDTGISLGLTAVADRVGRKRVLLLGAVLMFFAGVFFLSTTSVILLTIAATIGIISPSGYEVGPFLAIEQAALSQLTRDERRTHLLAWYNLVGSFSTATGALCAGGTAQLLQNAGLTPFGSYRAVISGYALTGIVLAALFAFLTPAVEAAPAGVPLSGGAPPARALIGLHRSRGIVFRLSALFSLDAFAGGFVIQSIVAYWFHVRFGVEPAVLGAIFFGANLLAGVSALAAARLAARIGLIRTMVFTHLPSNVLLVLVPLMPSVTWAVAVLLLRFSISQMDVPTRQSYSMAVVTPDERSAAAGVTGTARTVGAAVSPVLTGPMLANQALWGLPFFFAGGLKIVYDLLLYRSFRGIRPPEESPVSPREGV